MFPLLLVIKISIGGLYLSVYLEVCILKYLQYNAYDHIYLTVSSPFTQFWSLTCI